MTKNSIITEIYNRGVVKDQLKKYWSEDYKNLQDIEQDLYILLLQLPEELLQEMYDNGKLLHWIGATLRRQIHSKTSYYYKKYKDFKNRTSDINEHIDL